MHFLHRENFNLSIKFLIFPFDHGMMAKKWIPLAFLAMMVVLPLVQAAELPASFHTWQLDS